MRYLIDTNIIIYYLDNKIPEGSIEFLTEAFYTSFCISTITCIEVLGWPALTPVKRTAVERFLSAATVLYVDEVIQNQTIAIKSSKKIKTPDAIIAATAVVHGMAVITRNESDFQGIEGIEVYNPFA